MNKQNICVGLLVACLLGIVFVSFLYKQETEIRIFPGATIHHHSDDYWKGQFIFCLSCSTLEREVDHSFLVVMNSEGVVSHIRTCDLAYHDYIYQLSDHSKILYRLSGRRDAPEIQNLYVWDLNSGTTTEIFSAFDLSGHHELLIEDGYFVTLRRAEKGGLDTIVEFDETGELWKWSTEPYFDFPPCPSCNRPNDWLHSNDVSWSLDNEHYLINLRNANSFAKVNRETGELVWICGMKGNFTLLDAEGQETQSLWYHTHIIKEVEPNKYLMFDNDLHNLTKGLDSYPEWKGGNGWWTANYGGQSRLIEITVDEQNMTAWISWSYTAPETYFCAGFGDIDILPNGNVLGTFGMPVHQWFMNGTETGNPFGAVMLEITRTGEIVREYRFPLGYAIYRMQLLDVAEDILSPGVSHWVYNSDEIFGSYVA